MVYAIIYVRSPFQPFQALADALPLLSSSQSLFLGFGIAIGSDFFFLFDAAARRKNQALAASAQSAMTIMGHFIPDNSTTPMWAGTFTFSFVPFLPSRPFRCVVS